MLHRGAHDPSSVANRANNFAGPSSVGSGLCSAPSAHLHWRPRHERREQTAPPRASRRCRTALADEACARHARFPTKALKRSPPKSRESSSAAGAVNPRTSLLTRSLGSRGCRPGQALLDYRRGVLGDAAGWRAMATRYGRTATRFTNVSSRTADGETPSHLSTIPRSGRLHHE